MSRDWDLSGFKQFLLDLGLEDKESQLFGWLHRLVLESKNDSNNTNTTFTKEETVDEIINKLESLMNHKQYQNFTFDFEEAISLIGPNANYYNKALNDIND